MAKKIIINGRDLSIEDLYNLTKDPQIKVEVSPTVFVTIKKSRKFLEDALGKKVIYGVNTGFGPMASYIIDSRDLISLQENLIRSHAVGMGDPIPEEYVLAAMVVRLNTLVKGFSGVSPELIKHLEIFINNRIIPIIPEHGAVGTSGDLVQLAHIALALIGEGEAIYQGQRKPVSKILKSLDIKPYQLKAKEGLALINGTSMMSAVAALVCFNVNKLLNLSIRAGAFALELVHGFDDSISENLHKLRPHKGQVHIARLMRKILRSSRLLRSRDEFQDSVEIPKEVKEISQIVQEVYSFRCIPQILGPVFDIFDKVKNEVQIEINSVTDNPIIDWENEQFLHGGNFHGDYIAAGVDQLKIGLAKLTLLSERRINFFLNKKVNIHLPPFLNLHTPGLTLGLQGLQFVATSTTAQNQTLAFPHSVHSIPTNGDNQDVVSMGTDAALFAAKVVENLYIVLAIELITLAQAIDVFKTQDKLSESSKELFHGIREIFPVIINDRLLTNQLAEVVSFMKTNFYFNLEHR